MLAIVNSSCSRRELEMWVLAHLQPAGRAAAAAAAAAGGGGGGGSRGSALASTTSIRQLVLIPPPITCSPAVQSSSSVASVSSSSTDASDASDTGLLTVLDYNSSHCADQHHPHPHNHQNHHNHHSKQNSSSGPHTTATGSTFSSPSNSTTNPSSPSNPHLIQITANTYKLVILLDISASMSSVGGTGRPKVHLGVAFETICKCVDGITRSYSPTSTSTKIICPRIYVTVIADAGNQMFRKGRTTTNSEFCKNTPIRVLMQDVLVTSSYTSNNHSNNRSSCASGSGSLLDAFAESLYDALNEYECEMVESRLNDRVISTNGTTVNESVSGIDGGGGGGGGSNDDILSSSSQNGLDQQQQQEYLQQQQQQHSIYGSIPIKTRGGSIYSSLEYCMFALGLMGTTTNTNSSQASLSLTGSNALYPKQAIMPAVILITDGVATGAGTSEMIAKDFCRMLARDFVAFTVIQVGSRNGFYPGVNYGHVPDNEFIRFLAMATFGKFIYAADCKYLDPTPASSSTTIPPPPNFYHKHLLFREITISKLVIENIWRSVHGGNTERAVDLPRPRLVNVHADENVNNTNNNANYSSNSNINSTGGGGGGEETAAADMLLLHQQMTGSSIDDLRFPWDQQSKPPVVNMVLCGYRDYSLTVSLSHLLSARLLEGYAFRSIQVSQKSSSSASVGGGATATAPNPRPPKVEIILAMPWLPNVTIFYTIRTTWASFSSSSTSSPSSSSLLMNGLGGGGGSGGLVKARIELNILAHQAFAVLFVNLQKVDANAVFENALHEKVVMIHSYLRGVAESDERLKIIMSFNSKQAILSLYNSSTTPGGGGSSSGSDRGLSPVPPASERRPRSSSSSSHQFNSHQYWFSLGQLVVNKGLSFEEFSIDAILIEPPPSSSSSSPSSTPFVLSSQAGVRATSSPSFPDTGLKRNTINNSCNNNMPLFHLDMFRKLDSMPLISLFESWGAINLGRGLFMRFVFDEDHQPHLLPSASNGGGVPLSRQHSDEIPLTDRTTTTTTLSSPYLSTSSSLKKIPAGLNDIPIGFCFLRVAVENDCIVQIKLTFSSLTADKRQRVVDSLLADLKRIETISGCFYLCKKPMRQLLVSSTPSALTSNGRLKSVMAAKRNASNPAVVIATTAASPILYSQSSSAESSPATNQPGSKSSSSTSSSQDTLYLRKSQDIILLSSYLKHIKNIWLADIDSQKLMASAPNVGGSSSDDFVHSAFTLMARRRLSDGFYPVARSMTSILFYKEVELLNSSSTTSSTSNHPEGDVSPTPPHQDSVVCSLQYELVMNLGLGEVVSEIWWEPILKAESTTSSSSSSSSLPYSLVPVFQTIVTDIVAKDRQIVDYLYSVALVQYLACKPILPPPLDGWISSESSRQLIPRRLLRMFPNPGNLNIMKTLFEISSVLKRSSGVFVEAFKAPCIIVRAATTTTYNNNSDENNSRYAQQIDGSFSSSSDHGECSPSPSLEDNGQMSSSESSLLPARSDAPDTQPFSSPAAGFFTPLESPAIPIVPVTPPSTAAFTGTAGGMVAGVSQRLYSTFQSSSLRNEQLHFILPCLEEFDTAIALDILDCRSDRLMELIALNRFFEQSLIDFFTDAAFDPLKVDICDGSKMSVDYLCNFSNYIKDSILNHQRLVLPESCRSSKCLVKAKDENNFLLVFVPKNVIKDTKLSDDGANVGLDSISLTLFECISLAQDASDIISNDDSHDMFLTHEIHIISPIIKGFAGESSQKRYSVSAARSWRNPGVLDDGDRQDEVPSQSRFTSSFFLEADKAFSIALAKTLHFCLLYCTYLPVNADMVEAAIENECSDTFVSQIDITRFLNINYLLGSSVNQDLEAKKRRIDATLRRIISENFAAVPVAHHTVSSSSDSEAEPFTPVCDHFYYYLRPHHLASIASRFENDERGFPVEFVRSALSFASFPLFLQFSVCISDEKGHHLTPEKFNEFPVSYEQFGYNQEASKIGTESDPIASTNGIVATLKLTRFALPVISNDNAYLDGYGDDRNAILNERDSYIDLLVKSIQDFLNGEIIDGILDLNLQSPTCLLLMEKTLFSVLDNSLTPSVSSSNNSTSLFSKATSTASSSGQIMYSLSALPLEFVRKSESGIRTLQTEFQRHLFSNVNVKKVDNFFLMTVDPSLATASDSALFDNSHHSSKIWLLVTFSEEKLQASLLLFSKCAPESERMLLLESSKRGILECMQRVNRLVLLSELRETHTASLLMIHQNVPDVNLDGNIGSPPEDDVKVADVGKYSCSSVFKKSYPLHWRMKPVTALNNIVAAFQSMAIINRQNMLVFSSPTSTFYISFSIQEIETVDANMDSLPSENPSFTDLTSATSISGDILDYATGSAASLARCAARANVTAAAVAVSAAMHSDFKSGVITSPPRQKPYPKSRRFTMGASTFNMVPPLSLTKVDHLVIDVFGVDAPSFEITKEFCNLVEAKLNSNLLNIIGSFLARSGSLKLTMADIDFILPCSRPTSSSVKRVSRHVVPEGVIQNHSALLVMHIRQNISLFLSNVNREDFTPVLETYHGLQLPHDAPSSSGTSITEFQLGDLCFVYNSIPNGDPSPLEAQIGHGLACISVSLVDTSTAKPIGRVAAGLNSLALSDLSSAGPYETLIEIWPQGGINHDALAERIDLSIQQSIQDVIIECCLREEAVTGQEASLQSIPNSLDKASKSSNPSVQLLRSAVNLSSETSDNFIRDIQEALTASCSLLETLVIPNADSQWIIVSRLRQQPAGLSSTSTDVSPMMYAYQISCGDVQITARTLAACITLSHTEFTLYVYNWNKGIADDLFGRMLRLLSWNNIRMQFIAARTLARISRHIPPWEISTNEAIVTESNRSDNSAAAASEELLLLQKKAVEFIDWYVRIKSRNSLGNSIMESARLEKNASATSKSSAASSTANDILSSTSSTVASGNSSSGVDSYYSDRKYLSRRTSQFDISDSPSPSELAKLVRTAKLIHFARYPFFFTELREKVLSQLTGRSASLTRQWTTTLTSPNIHEGIRAAPLFDSDLEWTRHTIDAFLREYSEYLCSVGFEIINREERSSLIILSNDHGSINPTFIVNETSSIVSEIVYLRLRCSKGVVIAQIGFEDVYAHIYLYSLDTMEDASPAETPRSFRLASEKPDFSLECEMIKKSIHLFSFSYDFHIRTFQELIATARYSRLLDVMKAFVNYNKKKATVARNRIVHQTLATENAENLTPSLLSYILKNPDRYGFQALRSSFGDKSEACFCMSHQPDFDVERGRTSPSHVAISPPDFTYTLVMYPTDMASNMSNIQLDQQPTSIDGSLVKQCPLSFILLLNKSGSFNVAYADSATSGFFPVQDLGEIGALQEYLAEGFYLGDIVRYGIKKIERLVDQAIRYYGRDSLWRQLLAEKRAPLDPRPSVMSLATVETISKDDIITDIPSLSLSSQQPQPGQALDETKAAEWTRLFLEKISANSRDVITIDPSLSNLFSCSDVAWDQVMDHLKNIFNSTCRELCDVIAVDTNGKSKKQRRRHLMIFNAENHDYLIHMIVCDFPAVGGLSGFCRNNVLAAASVVENKENVSSASPKNMSVEIRAVSREGVSDEVEYSHINNVIQHVMMFILEINVNGDN